MRRTAPLLALLLAALSLAALSRAEVVAHGQFRVAVDASISPRRLPRSGASPVHFALSARFLSTHGTLPPQLRRIEIEINRNGHLDRAGLPNCSFEQIQPATSANALRACRSALVGEGRFSAQVRVAQEAPFPSEGKLLAFNGNWHGHPAVLAHIYGPKPVPTSYTIPFLITGGAHRTYGTTLRASLPHFSSKWGYVTMISLGLGRRFLHRGARHSYLSAGCPAPPGISIASFPLTRASFGFAGHQTLNSTLTRSCRARG